MRKLLCNHLLFNLNWNLSRKKEDQLADLSRCAISPCRERTGENGKPFHYTMWCWAHIKVFVKKKGRLVLSPGCKNLDLSQLREKCRKLIC